MPPTAPLASLIRSNRWFFSGFFQFLVFGGVLLVFMDTGDFVWFFNDRRSPFADWLFVYGTKLGEPIGFILAALGLLFVRLRHTLAIPLVGFSVSLVSFPLKRFFHHDRPLAFFEDAGLEDFLLFVEGVKVHSGPSSFPSGHTMAGFALFTFVALCVPAKKWGGTVFFLLALIVGLSRIYLTQHFFKDVYLGGAIGVLLGGFWYYLQALPQASWLDWRIGAEPELREPV